MKVIKPSHEIVSLISKGGREELLNIEDAGRTCYVSAPKNQSDISEEDAHKNFVRKLIANGHESVLEHAVISVRFICDRGVSHELVRHRLASYSQESTRYCNYSKDRFGNEITVIQPCFWNPDANDILWPSCDQEEKFIKVAKGASTDTKQFVMWYNTCQFLENRYFDLLGNGATPQEARAILPNSLKTVIRMTANCREWRHILKMRCAKDAHPQMRELMIPLLKELQSKIPVIFDDITE